MKDPQGIIPGATVTLINDATNVSRETVSNSVGEYSFPAVDPATYTVKASVQGYKTFERKGIRIGTQQFLTLDVQLDLGAIEETITVTGESPLIETSNASTGEVLDTRSLESIPTAGRSVFLMANLAPTVQTSGNAHWNRMQDQVGNSAMSMGGGAVRGNNYLVDGFPVTDLQNRASTNPSIEAVQDMKVQIHTYDAEMGRTGGGVMNMAAKSGSNDFRGSAYTVFRPESTVSQLLIPKLQGQKNVPEYWRDAGGGVGEEQNVLLVCRREVPRQPAAAVDVPRADRGRVARRFLGADAQRRSVLSEGSAGERHVQLHRRRSGVLPRKHHPGQSPQSDWRQARRLPAARGYAG